MVPNPRKRPRWTRPRRAVQIASRPPDLFEFTIGALLVQDSWLGSVPQQLNRPGRSAVSRVLDEARRLKAEVVGSEDDSSDHPDVGAIGAGHSGVGVALDLAGRAQELRQRPHL